MKDGSTLSPELLERVRRVGEIFRDIDDAALRESDPVVAQAMLVWDDLEMNPDDPTVVDITEGDPEE